MHIPGRCSYVEEYYILVLKSDIEIETIIEFSQNWVTLFDLLVG